MCKISIIVPIYNIENYLEKCISSLLKQTIINQMEIILINDGSTDNSLEICKEYETEHKSIRVINKLNGGVSSARNEGLKAANGEFIAFVDGDDYVDNWYYEELYNAAKENNADLVVFDYLLKFDNGEQKKYRNNAQNRSWNKFDAMQEFLSGGCIGVNLFDKLFKKDLLEGLFFEENIKIGEDLYFVYNYLKKVDKVSFCNKAGYYYLQRNNSAMNQKFQQKYFDVMIVSKLIVEDVKSFNPVLEPYAKALYIHSTYKTLERAYKLDADLGIFEEQISKLKAELKAFPITEAKKHLSSKQFAGFLLMRISVKLYLLVCSVMKI